MRRPILKMIALVLIAGELLVSKAQTASGAKAGGGSSPQGQAGGGNSPSKPADAVHDIVGQTFTSNAVADPGIPATLDQDLDALTDGKALKWNAIGTPYE